ncbi:MULTISPECIES: class I adenylate-forming enzyme family protein [Ensifer]|jgi:long-chain acyl-CoA synthetase|uniref:class I adenylate-forming enzyme family protein n=1 Tax=Ensifer TaxID=106591 RepID=UPI0007152DCB|nr:MULTISPECIES: class I adenylate-forming enzyme family protein [Ensifer]KQX43165.1 long-chain fatty acid--CoA ligase [Ensifer sp. Root1298]KQX72714.1 long-chain fatty acid--CoA ligase [Ensifer sp. Root1312]KRC15680.1 long-chain fatty acid--CoA ligase [Ensifer sp. Root74]KRD58954.1 long-chain fatty acid--CoA ligase [Ensifer sp. Root954]
MIHFELIAPVGEMLRRNAGLYPEKLAFEDRRRSVSYRGLESETRNLAFQFIAMGLEKGQAVAIFLPNSVNWVVACLAAVRAGGVAVPVSIESTEAELSYRVTDADCAFLVVPPEKRAMAEELVRRLGRSTLVVTESDNADFQIQLDVSTTSFEDDRDIDRPAYIVYTSGTTGQPKGVLLSTRSMLWVTASCWAPIAGLSENDVVLNTLPLYHSYALNIAVLSIIATGASEYIMEKFSTSQATDLLRTGRFTFMPGVPTVFHYFLSACQTSGERLLSSVRLCVSAGAILPGSLNNDFEDFFGVPLLDGYGITETSTMVTMNWPGKWRVSGSCGLPLPGLSVRLVDPNTGLDMPVDMEGELICKGPNLMQGYHNKPQETQKVVIDGWYHTGDLARCDQNGFLTITGRLKELIIRGGQNIAPAEVEETILLLDAVMDCAVIGMPHAMLGEVPVACVVLKTAATLDQDDLIGHCKARLSAYKIPDRIYVVDEIPRTGSGKILRVKLRERLPAA